MRTEKLTQKNITLIYETAASLFLRSDFGVRDLINYAKENEECSKIDVPPSTVPIHTGIDFNKDVHYVLQVLFSFSNESKEKIMDLYAMRISESVKFIFNSTLNDEDNLDQIRNKVMNVHIEADREEYEDYYLGRYVERFIFKDKDRKEQLKELWEAWTRCYCFMHPAFTNDRSMLIKLHRSIIFEPEAARDTKAYLMRYQNNTIFYDELVTMLSLVAEGNIIGPYPYQPKKKQYGSQYELEISHKQARAAQKDLYPGWDKTVDLTNMLRKNGSPVLQAGAMPNEDAIRKMNISDLIGQEFLRQIAFAHVHQIPIYEIVQVFSREKNLKKKKEAVTRAVNGAFLSAEHLDYPLTDEEFRQNLTLCKVVVSMAISNFLLLMVDENRVAGYMLAQTLRQGSPEKEKTRKKKTAETVRLKEQLEKKQAQIKDLNKEITQLKQQLSEYKEYNKKARAEAADLRKEKKALSKRLAQKEQEEKGPQDEAVFSDSEEVTQNPDVHVLTEEEFLEKINGKNVLVWGLRPDFKRELLKYENIDCVVSEKSKGSKFSLDRMKRYDAAVIVTASTSHGTYYAVRDRIKEAGVPYVHMRKEENNIQRFKERIYQALDH